jgi:hypothetical protein
MKFLKSLVFSFFTLSTIVVSGQLDLDETLTVEELVNEVLLGDGVNAFNITYNGEPGDQVELQAGSFNAVGSTFPIDSGVVMTTSSLDIVNTGEGNNTDPFPDYADPDLAMIAGFASRNASVIEFDFTVSSDSVKFNYIFASAEYPSFTCSNYNDVFGFFLSGPGITYLGQIFKWELILSIQECPQTLRIVWTLIRTTKMIQFTLLAIIHLKRMPCRYEVILWF